MGNEAIARGALEAGLGFASAYPGNPSSEIIGSPAGGAPGVDIHAQWAGKGKVGPGGAAGPIHKRAELPLLEPATFQEAKEMTKWAFELSEKIKNVCVIRSVTRVSHARGDVRLAVLMPPGGSARFAPALLGQFTPFLVTLKHNMLHQKVKQAREAFETSPFNWYTGPEKPDLLIVPWGSGWYYSPAGGGGCG